VPCYIVMQWLAVSTQVFIYRQDASMAQVHKHRNYVVMLDQRHNVKTAGIREFHRTSVWNATAVGMTRFPMLIGAFSESLTLPLMKQVLGLCSAMLSLRSTVTLL